MPSIKKVEKRIKSERAFEDMSQKLDDASESIEIGFRDDYFLSDPAAFWDILPQPFNMIEKTLEHLLECVWSAIEQRQRVKRSQRISRHNSLSSFSPTVYGPNGILSQVTNISSASSSLDDPYIVFGTKSGLYVMDGFSQTICASWQGLTSEIAEIHLYSTQYKMFLITTVDDLGDARVFLFVEPDIIHMVFNVYDKVENEVKPLIVSCSASRKGEQMAVSVDSRANRKGRFIMVYSLPLETWMTQLCSRKLTKQENTQSNPTESQENEEIESTETIEEKVLQFSKPNLLIKIPAYEIGPGYSGKSLQQICKSVDVSGEVIGTGLNNIISQAHLDLRKAVLEYQHEDLKRHSQDEETSLPPLSVKFINSTTLLGCVPDAQNQAHSPAVLVWSFGSHILYLYSLTKARKDINFVEPDRVWPFGAPITAVNASHFSTILAVGLKNGCIVVIDIYYDVLHGVSYVGGPSPVKHLHFVHCGKKEDPGETVEFSCNLIAVLENGITKRFHFSALEYLSSVTILPESHTSDTLVMQLLPIPGKYELILISFNNGVVVLVDVFEGDTLCELQLFSGYQLTCSWSPIISIVSGEVDDKICSYAYIVGASESALGCCFYFILNELPVLINYWVTLSELHRFVSPVLLEDKLNIFLNSRKNQQKDRNARLKSRWKNFINFIPTTLEEQSDSKS